VVIQATERALSAVYIQMKGRGMKATQLVLIAGLIAGYMGAGGAAFAHGEKAHDKKTPAAVKKEQQAWGIAGDARAAKRTVEVTMADDMKFSPDKLDVKQGETIRFVLKNGGKLMHEMVIGTKKVLDEHAKMMEKFPNMEHDEPYMAHVAPGKTGEIIWTFNRAGKFDFACLISGHYSAGMKGVIRVAAK
jgi:uncharacterized cupredoxin-like copper-binding protein